MEKTQITISPRDLHIGGNYYLDGCGMCEYKGTDEYHGQLTYKFWNLEYRQNQYELNTDRVYKEDLRCD